MASVDTFIASIVVGVSNAQIAWTLLHTSYTNKSHAHVYSLWDQLNRVTKDDKTIIEYLHQIKTISDELAIAGSSIATEELIVKLLRGLGLDYREVSFAIYNRGIPIAYKELFEKLLDHEIFLQHEGQRVSYPITTSLSNKTSASSHNYHNNHRPLPPSYWIWIS